MKIFRSTLSTPEILGDHIRGWLCDANPAFPTLVAGFLFVEGAYRCVCPCTAHSALSYPFGGIYESFRDKLSSSVGSSVSCCSVHFLSALAMFSGNTRASFVPEFYRLVDRSSSTDCRVKARISNLALLLN